MHLIRPITNTASCVDGRDELQGRGVNLRVRCVNDVNLEEMCFPAEDEVPGEELTAEQDTETKRVLPTPILPSAAEIEDHRIDHMPYRSWCPDCVEGRGREAPHHAHRSERDIPVISMDYMFVMPKGMYTQSELVELPVDDREGGIKVIVIRDSLSKAVFAHAVPKKGVDPDRYVADCVVSSIEWLGYSKLMLKSDNEPAIMQVVRESLKILRIEGSLQQGAAEGSVPYDPQSNGSAETGVRLEKGQMRTLKSGLERRLQRKIPPSHPIMSWLVRHAADLLTYRLKGSDGLTPYRRIRGRVFSQRLAEFGEYVRYKISKFRHNMRSQDVAEQDGGAGVRWKYGIFVGFCKHTCQYLIYSEGKVQSARTIMRNPDEIKWKPDEVQKVDVTPWD